MTRQRKARRGEADRTDPPLSCRSRVSVWKEVGDHTQEVDIDLKEVRRFQSIWGWGAGTERL
jgi:hypothetical protein